MANRISILIIDIGDFIIEKITSKFTIPVIIFILGMICGYAWMWATVN